jgi:hypothetical protein
MLLRHCVIATGLTAALVVSMTGVEAARAAYPVQPKFHVRGGEIGTPFEIEYRTSGRIRLWVVAQTAATAPPKFVLTCTSAVDALGSVHNKLEANGKGKAQLAFSGCTANKASLTDNNTFEEGAQLTACTIKQAEAVAGIIETNPIGTRLVWNETAVVANRRILNFFEPENALKTFFEVNITGGTCPIAGAYALTGGALGFTVLGYGTENPRELFDFTTSNATAMLEPFYKNWRVELSGVTTNSIAKLTFEKGLCPVEMLAAVLEGMFSVELSRINGVRYNLGVYE